MMRNLLLLILTALAATIFPPSLLLLLSTPSSCCYATALPHISRIALASSLTTTSHHVVASSTSPTLQNGNRNGEFIIPPSVPGGTLTVGDAFKVSVGSEVVDSTCVYSMVEFRNDHPTEDITIYSAHIEPSIVFPRPTADSIAPNPLKSTPPPLFPEGATHSSQQPPPQQRDGGLRIYPGSTVTVPVSILPHYKRYDGPRTHAAPPPTKEHIIQPSNRILDSLSASSSSQPSPGNTLEEEFWKDISLANSINYHSQQPSIQLDIMQMVQDIIDYREHPPPEETNYEHIVAQSEIHETLLANTSWGFLRMKVPQACSVDSKEYGYGLPNNLMFLDGGGGWYARRNGTSALSDGSSLCHSDLFEFEVFMDNPSDSIIDVWDVFTTKPNLVGVNDVMSDEGTSWLWPFGGITIPPGKSNVHVATIQLLPAELNYADLSSVVDLGFLELRTSAGAFSIGLDFIPNRRRQGVVHGLGSNHSTVGNVELAKQWKLNNIMSYMRESEYFPRDAGMINVYRKSDKNQRKATKQFLEQMRIGNQIIEINHSEFDEDEPALLVQPSFVDFGVITSGSKSMRLPLNLANTRPFATQLMRMSVSMRMITEDGIVHLDEFHKLSVGLEFMGGKMLQLLHQNRVSYEFPNDIILMQGQTYQFPINVLCHFRVSPDHVVTPRTYEGSIVFRSAVVDVIANTTYNEWIEQTVLNDPLSSTLMTVVPFRVRVIPGNFRISTGTLLFPTHFTMLPPEELIKARALNHKKEPDYFDRYLEVTNNFVVPITIKSLEINNSREYGLCSSAFSVPEPESLLAMLNSPTAESNSTWSIPIRFTFNSYLNSIRSSKKCILTMDTDQVGKQSLPLIIHNGNLITEVQLGEMGVQKNECLISNNGSLTTERGMRCLDDWVENKAEGQGFRRELKKMITGLGSNCFPHSSTLKRPEVAYFPTLFSTDVLNEVDPIMMKFGAVSSGTVVKQSILLTNMNPATIEVTPYSAAFAHMHVTIGHKPISILDAIEQSPKDNYMKYFLTHSAPARSFLSKLKYKTDISLSPRASMGELSALYDSEAVEYTFPNSTGYQGNDNNQTKKEEMSCSGGFVASTDGVYHKQLSSRMVSTRRWKIPPGGVARFEVALHTPSRSELQSDMTSFVAAGLALQTNYGQAFPIVLTYSVFLGELQLVPSQTSPVNIHGYKATDDSLQISMNIRDDASQPNIDDKGVPISIHSTFSKEVLLGEIRSCNRWFDFTRIPKRPPNVQTNSSFASNFLPIEAVNKSQSDLPTVVHIGKVSSTVRCLDQSGSASFFSCALAWLVNREKIQPNGCGLSDEEIFLVHPETKLDTSIKQLKADATDALISAVSYLAKRQEVGGYVMPSDIHIIQKARQAWNLFSSHGLNVITGHLTAMSSYHDEESHADKQSQNKFNATTNVLADIMNSHGNLKPVPVNSMLLRSTLDIPQLFDGKWESAAGVVDFDPIHVAETSSRYISVSNPSDVSVRVQLSAAITGSDLDGDLFLGRKEFMQTSVTDRDTWWTGESYWISGKDGHLVGASHNVTFTSGSGSTVNLVQPSLQSISTFVIGCGTRCGRRSDAENADEELLFSTVGSASGSQSMLLGHPWHVTGKPPTPPKKFNIMDPQPFSVGHSGVQEVVLPPRGKAKLGPVFFRPTKRGEFNTSLFISNNLTGFEEVKLRGRGLWEKLVFLDNDDSSGGDIEFRNGRSALVFSGSATSENKAVVKSFVLANLGDVAVNISSVSMRSSEIKHFSHKSAHPTSLYEQHRLWGLFSKSHRESNDRCSNARFHLVGCTDVKLFPEGWIQRLFPWYFTTNHASPPLVSRFKSSFSANTTSFHDGFTLRPNENVTFSVEHHPDCVLRASYASVIFEISGRDVLSSMDQWRQTFRNDKLELLVGYNMNPYAYCIPYVPPSSQILVEKAFSFLSRVWSALSFGFIRRKEDHGSPYIQYEVEVSYMAALFFLLVALLIFDLYASVDFLQGDDPQGSSWKQTLRCLARADPVSSDLVALGKEQTKHVLLSRFRKENVLPTSCVLSDGSFFRDKPGGEASPSSAPYKRMPSSNQQAKTFSDIVFHRHNFLVNESTSDDSNDAIVSSGVLPCGISWRTAARRGISVSRSVPSSSLVEPQRLARTRNALLKKKQLQPKKRVHSDTSASSISPKISHADIHDSHDTHIRTNDVRPPQDQRQTTDRTASDKGSILAQKESSIHQPTPTQVTHKVNRKPQATSSRKEAHSAQKPPEVKATVSTKSSVKIEHKARHTDGSKDNQIQAVSTSTKETKNDRQNRTLTVNKSVKETKTISNKTSKSTKQVSESASNNLVSNGKEKSGLASPSQPANFQPSATIVVKQPSKVHKAKEVNSKKNGASVVEKEVKKDIRKSQGSNPQAKVQATTKVDSKPSFQKRSTSEESMPSSTPVSSAQPSPRSDTSNITPKPLPTKGMMRPPPGLLPPPGFVEPPFSSECTSPSRSKGANTPTLLSREPSFSEPSPTKTPNIMPEMKVPVSPPFRLHHESIPSPSLAGLLSPHLEDDDKQHSPNEEFVNNSMLITDLLPPPPRLTPPLLESVQSDVAESVNESADVQDLLGSNNSFNVMSFLDGIMNDPPKPIRSKEPVQAASTPAGANPVSLDPWGNSLSQESPRNNPLAAIIGRISDVEATTLRGQDDQLEIAGIPLTAGNAPSLLSPSALQSNISAIEPTYASLATEVHDEDDELLEPDSFYSQLLAGE